MAPSPPPWDVEAVDGELALEEAGAFVALGPRDAGTAGAAAAAHYLAARLQALGVTAVTDEFRDPTPAGERVFRNVLALLDGPSDRLVILASHYDTKAGVSPDFAGANDSGSSTGLLLALAPLLGRPAAPAPDIVLAFLDGEECHTRYGPRDGLHGSRRLARRLQADGRATNVLAVIVLDMIGDRDLTVTVPRNATPALMQTAFRAAREEGARQQFALGGGPVIDDHVPFLEAGMPAVDLIDFAYGSAPGLNDYWHTPADTLDKLSPASLRTVGRVTVRMLNHLASCSSSAPPLYSPAR